MTAAEVTAADLDATRLVHPELVKPLEGYRRAVGDGGLGAIADVNERRAMHRGSSRRAAAGRSRPVGVDVQDRDVPGLAGSPSVKIRLYRPSNYNGIGEMSAWIYVHGGGMTVGDLDSSDLAAAQLAADSGCVILSVDYRLAPETRFPGPVDDCTAALTWLHAEARDFGVRPDRVGVYGVSAGGLLAAALAQRSRDGAAPTVAKQILIYPMLDDRTSEQARGAAAVPGTWNNSSNARAWEDYLGPDVDRRVPPPYAVPGRAGALRGLPPAYIEVGSIDILAPESVEYASRLMAAGVPTELHVYPGAYHAFDVIAASSGLAATARAQRLCAMNEI